MTFPRKQIPFQTEPVPVYGQAVAVAEGVMRITAQNPGVMTYHGTNTYLVRAAERLLLVDPGPALDAHIAAVLACASRDFGLAVTDILLTHGHHDHIGACAVLRAATGAPVYGAATAPLSDHVRVDHPLHEGMAIGSLTALATPGHTADHFCFARAQDGLLFSGDHVLSFSSTIVTAAHGNMAAYMDSLRRLITRDDPCLLPAHGPVVHHPLALYQGLLDLRLRREEELMLALAAGPQPLDSLVARLYPHRTHPKSREAAGFNLISHMRKLMSDNRVHEIAPHVWALGAATV